MSNNKKNVTAITSMDTDFAKWYTDIVKQARLIDYSSVRGCVILRPYGYALWEGIQKDLDARFKATGHENVYMPMFIPESLLQKEKDHVEGFAPEVAWITHGGGEKLAERLCVRPTSETLFCEHYKNVVHSYRDLPKLYNQWCSVVRWEKTTRPFLRSLEFLWQEGHTIHATEQEAIEETERMLDVYADFCEETLAIPVTKGLKTEKEKFSGAVRTYSIEALMHNGYALQSGTSHFFGDGFARAFDITFTDKDNSVKFPFGTSWGVSTRLIGAVIMVHGDDNGLVLPPKIAPTQVVIVPAAMQKEGVLEKCNEVCDQLKSTGLRTKLDDTDQSAGWKFAEYEMQGVPIRLELGPRDIEAGQCVLVRRDTGEKSFVPLENIAETVAKLLEDIHAAMLAKAAANVANRTFEAKSLDELKSISADQNGYFKGMWCGELDCELKIKEQAGLSSRCMPFTEEKIDNKCVCCGKPADKLVLWGRAY
jgi:prolyl-tRNA synthetase, family I